MNAKPDGTNSSENIDDKINRFLEKLHEDDPHYVSPSSDLDFGNAAPATVSPPPAPAPAPTPTPAPAQKASPPAEVVAQKPIEPEIPPAEEQVVIPPAPQTLEEEPSKRASKRKASDTVTSAPPETKVSPAPTKEAVESFPTESTPATRRSQKNVKAAPVISEKNPETPRAKKTAPAVTQAPPAAINPTDANPSSPRGLRSPSKRNIVVGAIGVGVVAVTAFTLMTFELVTVSEGITTNHGLGDGQTVLIHKTTEAAQSDLVVGIMPGTTGTDNEEYVMGTVFSLNDETYAIYDGEVVWQVPFAELKGKVLFSTPEQTPGSN